VLIIPIIAGTNRDQDRDQDRDSAVQLIEEGVREEARRGRCAMLNYRYLYATTCTLLLVAPVCGVSDAVSLAHGWVASSEVPAAAFLWRRVST
jgi:hypothetical protein